MNKTSRIPPILQEGGHADAPYALCQDQTTQVALLRRLAFLVPATCIGKLRGRDRDLGQLVGTEHSADKLVGLQPPPADLQRRAVLLHRHDLHGLGQDRAGDNHARLDCPAPSILFTLHRLPTLDAIRRRLAP